MHQNEHSLLYYVSSLGLVRNGLVQEAIVLGVKSKGDGWTDEDTPALDHALAWALKTWPVDTDRVYGYGISNGAMRMGLFAPRHQGLLAAAVLLSGNVRDLPPTPAGGQPDLAMYVMHGDADPIVPVQEGRDAARDLAAAHYQVVYREYAGEKHIYSGPRNLVLSQPDAVRWLFTQRLRHAPATPALAAQVGAARAAAQGAAEVKDTALAPLAELAGTEVDAVLAEALAATAPKTRLAAARLCTTRLYGRPVLAALCPLATDKDTEVRRTAIAALGLAANWQHAETLAALEAVAADAKAADRVGAAAQLAAAWPMQRLQSNADPVLKTTLEALANDRDAAIRELAAHGLNGTLVRDGLGVKVVPDPQPKPAPAAKK
jgi:dienelactone hydrolase